MAIKEVLWENVREKIAHINPTLTQLIDNVSPGKTLPFVEIHYRYGDLIIDKGKMALPSELTTDIEQSQTFEKLCRDRLSYSPIPLGLLLNKASEVFIEQNKQSIPLKILQPGSFFGLFEWFDQFAKVTPFPVWSVASGARTAFLLPKIANIASHRRLRKELGIQAAAPRHLNEHWQVFKEIAQAAPEKWISRVLFFPKEWFDEKRLHRDIHWTQLYFYLLNQAWFHAKNGRGEIVFSVLWDTFIEAISRRRFRARPHAIHFIRHIVNICRGGFPGFALIENDDRFMPNSFIEKVYTSTYDIPKFYPSIMCSRHRLKPQDIVYFSLSLPTVMAGFHDIRQYSLIEEQRNIKYLLEMFQESFMERSMEFNDELLMNSHFSHFHSEMDILAGIQSSDTIPNMDDRFLDSRMSNKIFCHTSLFWRGCIAISNKTQKS